MMGDQQGFPQLGASARTLGARAGIDVPAVRPNDLVQVGQGGMSVSPDDPMNLPAYRRPAEFGGTGNDPVWSIDDIDLGGELVYRQDPRKAGHGFLEPARLMTLAEYQLALELTRPLWRKVTPKTVSRSSSDDS